MLKEVSYLTLLINIIQNSDFFSKKTEFSLSVPKFTDYSKICTGSSWLMRISLLRISLLRFFKTKTKIWLMQFFGLCSKSTGWAGCIVTPWRSLMDTRLYIWKPNIVIEFNHYLQPVFLVSSNWKLGNTTWIHFKAVTVIFHVHFMLFL